MLKRVQNLGFQWAHLAALERVYDGALKSDSDVASIKDAAPAPSQDPCRLISYEIAVHIIFYPELPPPAAVLYMWLNDYTMSVLLENKRHEIYVAVVAFLTVLLITGYCSASCGAAWDLYLEVRVMSLRFNCSFYPIVWKDVCQFIYTSLQPKELDGFKLMKDY